MRILYIARHGEGDNDPEGAIEYALRVLGHEVVPIKERGVRYNIETSGIAKRSDLCLFHKWDSQSELRYIRQELGIPCVFWHFDLIDAKDPSVADRSRLRIEWMNRIVPLVNLGFCTDGDWVSLYTHSRKLHWLMQGADERVTGPGIAPLNASPSIDILFTGTPVRNGTSRSEWVQWMRDTYGDRFRIIGPDQRRGRIVRRNLADLVASTKIVIAPDGPQTDRYWSNRVYLTLGFQGFLLHPYCEGLRQHYTISELPMYQSRKTCEMLIDQFLQAPQYRADIARAGYERTMKEHLYRHRLQSMLSTIKERLGIS